MRHLLSTLLVSVALIAVTACGASGPNLESSTSSSTTTTSPPATTTTAPPPTSAPSTTVPATTATTEASFDGAVVEVEVSGEDVTGGGRVEVKLGTTVRLTVRADRDDEVHVHGYDISGSVGPSRPAVLEFVADIPGVFEVELEESGLPILELEVTP